MPYSFQNDPKFLQKMLRIIPKAQKLFLEVDEHKIAFEYFLNEILDLTESEYGFIGDVILDPNTNRPFLKTHSITNIAWDVETREFFQANYAKGLEFRNLKTLFGYVIKNEIVIISNNVKNDPRSSGIPSGHPPLNSFLGLPIKINDKMIAMVGLANRKDEYTNDLVEALEPILFSLSSFLSTLQIRKKNKEEEAEKNSLIEKFQKFSDIVPGMLYQYLLKPDGTGSFPYTSKGIEQIYKIKSEDISENVDILTSIIHPEDMNSVVESIIESANTLQPWQHEYRVLDQDLGVRWLLGRSKPEKNEDGSILWHGFVMDISDQRNYETEIIQSKLEAEKANQIKSAFLANVSHEIRTPLNGILGFSELLNETWLTEIQRDHLKSIQISTETLLNIINDLIDLSHIESKKIKLSMDPVDIRRLLQNLVHTLGLQAKEKGLSFDCFIEHNIPEFIQSDFVRLNQVLTNLVTNSLKFSDSGKINISVTKNVNTLKFQISDSGIGIPQDMIHRITEPFFQVDSSRTKKYKGTGLGLSICKRILEQMNSSLNIQSVIGKGTITSFEIPLEIPKLHHEKEQTLNLDLNSNKKPIETLKSQLRILIVEDNELNLIFAKRAILKHFPFSDVLEAANGEVAIDIFKKEKLDLILMDIQMPVMDGYSATLKIREIENGKSHVPIVALTAGAQAGDKEKGLSVGMDEYLTKPIHISELQKVIHKYV